MAHTPGVTDAIEFAVPKDVQNHPVREFDRVRQRELWWWVLVVSVLVGGLLLLTWQHYQFTDLGYGIDRLTQAAAAEESVRRHLLVEQATLRSPQRIEEIAMTQLHMVAPTQTEAVVIERVRQAAQPSRTLVARR
jgi:cell division protein FtsL